VQTGVREADAGPVALVPVWRRRGVRDIGVASFLSDLGHEVPTALLPSLLTSTLGAPAALLGLIEGVSDGLGGLARLGGGALADDPQRRRVTAVGGYATTAVLTSAIGAATAVWQVAVLRAGGWVARGVRGPAKNALLADVVEPHEYGRAYGFERALDNAGALGGPLLALVLVSAVGVRGAILLSVIPGLLAALAMLGAVRAAPRAVHLERRPVRLSVRPVLRGRLGRALAGVAAFEAANVAVTLLILRATEALQGPYGHDDAVKLALVLYAGFNVAATAASALGGAASDRRGPTSVLTAGFTLAAAAYAGFAVAGATVAVLAALFAAAGAAKGLVETAEHTVVAVLAPSDVRGSAFGVLAGIQSFGNLAASAVAGIVWTAVSPRAAFLYLAALVLVAIVVTGTGLRRR
jgi:MFS family permease